MYWWKLSWVSCISWCFGGYLTPPWGRLWHLRGANTYCTHVTKRQTSTAAPHRSYRNTILDVSKACECLRFVFYVYVVWTLRPLDANLDRILYFFFWWAERRIDLSYNHRNHQQLNNTIIRPSRQILDSYLLTCYEERPRLAIYSTATPQ